MKQKITPYSRFLPQTHTHAHAQYYQSLASMHSTKNRQIFEYDDWKKNSWMAFFPFETQSVWERGGREKEAWAQKFLWYIQIFLFHILKGNKWALCSTSRSCMNSNNDGNGDGKYYDKHCMQWIFACWNACCSFMNRNRKFYTHSCTLVQTLCPFTFVLGDTAWRVRANQSIWIDV